MDDLTIAMCVHSLVISCRYTNTGNQDQQLDGLLQYEDEGWNSADHEDDFPHLMNFIFREMLLEGR